LFDGLAVAMEMVELDAILWVLQPPHPLFIIAFFSAR